MRTIVDRVRWRRRSAGSTTRRGCPRCGNVYDIRYDTHRCSPAERPRVEDWLVAAGITITAVIVVVAALLLIP